MIIGNIGFELMAPALKKTGASSLLIITTKEPINANLADRSFFFRENTDDFWPLMKTVLENDVDTVISISGPDFANVRDGYLKRYLEKLGIKTIANPLDAVQIAADKIKTKTFLKENEFPYVEGDIAFSKKEAVYLAEKIGYPIVVKRTSDAGGRGFLVIGNESRLTSYLDEAEDDFPMLLEEYSPGYEFSVEVLNYKGKALPLNPVYKGFTMPCGIHPMERIKIAPPVINADKLAILRGTARRVVTKLGLEPTGDVDFVWTDSGLKIFEINPRFGGVTAVSMASSHINCYAALVDMATDKWSPEKLKVERYTAIDIPVFKELSDETADFLFTLPEVFRIKRQNLKISKGRITMVSEEPDSLLKVLEKLSKNCRTYFEYHNIKNIFNELPLIS